MRPALLLILLALCAALAGCRDDDRTRGSATGAARACDAEPEILATEAGIRFVRTPDSCFDNLPDWPYVPRYVEIDGLRQAYVDEGAADGPVVLLLHGQPSWSYLYRKMIPVLADAGFRVIAMDHLGMGRSDKPTDIDSFSFLGHHDRLARFVDELGLDDIHLFVQDWGSLIGLRYAGLNPDRFARIAVGDGTLPVVPAGFQPFPPVENPNEIQDIASTFADVPAQQPLFYDGCDPLFPAETDFGAWMTYSMTGRSFRPSEVVEALTWFDLPADEEAAYDAPFPSRIYMAGPRVFPSLINELGGVNDEARAGLDSFTRPFLTIWAANDLSDLGQCATQDALADSVPGAAGFPRIRLPEASHFLQDDQGEEIARRLVEFFSFRSLGRGDRYCEVLLAMPSSTGVEASVWGTQGISDCPAAAWDALDADTIRSETNSVAVILNGPRLWLPNGTTGTLPSDERRTFGDLEMRLLATVQVDPSQIGGTYEETSVRRTTTFFFDAGEEIYELTSPDGGVYVMQSVSQIVDPNLALADMATLHQRLQLPAGWTYAARTLEEKLVLSAEGEAIVLQDDLSNTYQRATAPSASTPTPSAPPTPTPANGLPILGNGTGTSCDSDERCEGLDAAHCLQANGAGFCTVEGCVAGSCGDPYVCCYGCSDFAAPFLPFEGSACLPAALTQQLTQQAGCTCGQTGGEPTVTPTPTATATVDPAGSTPTPGVACLSSVAREIPGDLPVESPFGAVDRLEIQAVNEAGCAALDGPLVAFNWFSFDDREQYMRYASGVAEIFAQRGHRVLFGGQRAESLETPRGAPAGGGSYDHEELALALYRSAGSFLDMLLSPEFQAISVDQQGGARQQDYVWGLQRCLIGCDEDAGPLEEGLYLAHIFDFAGDDIDAAISKVAVAPGGPPIAYAGELVAELRAIVGDLAINPQNSLWGDGVVLYRVADRDDAERWLADPAFLDLRSETDEDVVALIETAR